VGSTPTRLRQEDHELTEKASLARISREAFLLFVLPNGPRTADPGARGGFPSIYYPTFHESVVSTLKNKRLDNNIRGTPLRDQVPFMPEKLFA